MMTADRTTARSRRFVVPSPRRAHDAETGGLVVVAVDGSERSVDALVWALKHARDEDRPVLVVTAWPLRHRAFVHEVPGHFNDARWEAREAQARAIARALSLVADAPRVESALVNAPLLDVIVAHARPDRLIVLGTDRSDVSTVGSEDSLTSRAQRAADGPVLLITPPTGGEEDR